MKKTFFLGLFIAASLLISGQGKTLYTVNFVEPKAGQKGAFETSWKAHLAKFHKVDKRNVYEIVSGQYNGAYLIVEGPHSYADLDTEKPMSKEHRVDLDKNFFPMLKENKITGTYRWDDTSSFNGTVKADNFIVTVTHLKVGQQPATMREAKRSSLIQAKINPASRISSNTYYQIWQGSKPTMVTIRNLKDGFKELETNYYGTNMNPPNAFKDAYVAAYGQDGWDARSKLLDENANIESREVYIMKLRKDLSSQ